MAISTVTELKMFIDGQWVDASGGGWIDVHSPATGELVGRVPAGTLEDVDRAVAAARRAFDDGRWRSKMGAEKVAILNKLADLIDEHTAELAELESAQTGTAIKLRRDSDMPFAADNIRFFATAVRHLEGKAASEYSGGHTSMIRREPLGVVGQVTPWNYPVLMAVWKIGPALAAGNSVVLKPASATPLTTLKLAELAHEAGVPDGVFNVVTGPGDVVGAGIAAHPGIDLVSLTGDSETGKKIMGLATGNLKRVHLELGGKAPFIVYADADLDAAARGAVAGGFVNAGQDCTAATRVYVQKPVYDEFLKRLKGYVETVRVGDPATESTDMGSLISEAQVRRVEGFVERAQARWRAGADGRPSGEGRGPGRRLLRADRHRGCGPGQRDRAAGDLRAGADGAALRHRGRGAGQGQRHQVRPGQLGLDARHLQGHEGRPDRSTSGRCG